jgi:hypothetical protein
VGAGSVDACRDCQTRCSSYLLEWGFAVKYNIDKNHTGRI